MVNQQFNCMCNAHCSYLLNLENSLLSQSLSYTTQYTVLYALIELILNQFICCIDGPTVQSKGQYWCPNKSPLLLAFSAGSACYVPDYSLALGTLGCLQGFMWMTFSEVVRCTARASRIFECSWLCIVMHYCNPCMIKLYSPIRHNAFCHVCRDSWAVK